MQLTEVTLYIFVRVACSDFDQEMEGMDTKGIELIYIYIEL